MDGSGQTYALAQPRQEATCWNHDPAATRAGDRTGQEATEPIVTSAALVFPHQLYADHPALEGADRVVMVEDTLYFGDPANPMRFHKQRLWLHRASMKHYERRLERAGHAVDYVDYEPKRRTLHRLFERLRGEGVTRLQWCDPTDFLLEKRVRDYSGDLGLELVTHENPDFINERRLNEEYADGHKWFMADFYKYQRRRLDVMMEGTKPQGGQWSFDHDNRKKVPKSKLDDLPRLEPLNAGPVEQEARQYVERRFADRYGSLETLHYPTTHDGASHHLDVFLRQRLELFGDYEDAIVEGEHWLWHAVLTPMLNTGLILPRDVINRTLEFAEAEGTRLNSLEGFVRQIIGWREFMRASYEDLGVRMRATADKGGNHWNHTRRLPESFWTGETGIDPVDDVIRRVGDVGYAHHIERLMVMGGFMFLCEIDPDDVYTWFMEMFVDAYDWVMVPNTYAMSQHSDGGLITTKPYFSGSAYIRKQSNFAPGPWAEVWDGLYWRFIWHHRERLRENRRWTMMVRTAERMDEKKMRAHVKRADAFLAQLDAEGPRAAWSLD